MKNQWMVIKSAKFQSQPPWWCWMSWFQLLSAVTVVEVNWITWEATATEPWKMTSNLWTGMALRVIYYIAIHSSWKGQFIVELSFTNSDFPWLLCLFTRLPEGELGEARFSSSSAVATSLNLALDALSAMEVLDLPRTGEKTLCRKHLVYSMVCTTK